MFAGHIGVALAAGRIEPQVNVGVFAAAAMLLDALLWAFVLLGWEAVTIPADFAATHQAAFVFPYSHGLLAAVAWSALCGAVAFLLRSARGHARWRAPALVMAVVFSHWLLDAMVHRPELPLVGAASPVLGIGLWDHMGLALAVESALVAAGMIVFFPACRLPRARRLGLATLVLLVLAFTIAGMTVAPAPPSGAAMATSSLVTVVLVCALMGWLGRIGRNTAR